MTCVQCCGGVRRLQSYLFRADGGKTNGTDGGREVVRKQRRDGWNGKEAEEVKHLRDVNNSKGGEGGEKDGGGEHKTVGKRD